MCHSLTYCREEHYSESELSKMSDKEGTPPFKDDNQNEEGANGVTNVKSRSRSHSSSRSGSHHSDSRSASPRSRSRSKSRSASGKSGSRSRSHSSHGRSRSRSRSRGRKSSYSRSRKRSYSRSRSHSPSRKRRSSYRSRSRSRSPPHRRSYYGRRNDNRDNPTPSRCLGVFGLSLYTTERDLRNLFEKYSDVESIQIVYDHQTGRSRGYAFVYFPNEKHATTCKENTNGQELDGRQIRVDYSITKNAHNPTPGVYMGKPSQFSRKPYRGGGSSSRYDSRDRYGSYRSRSRSRSHSPRRY